MKLLRMVIKEPVIFLTQSTQLLDAENDSEAPHPEEARRILEDKFRNAEELAKDMNCGIVMWAPKGPMAGRLLQCIAQAQATAIGTGNIYLIEQVAPHLQGLREEDFAYLWKSPYMSNRWGTVVKCVGTPEAPVSIIRPGAATLAVSPSPLVVIACSRDGGGHIA